jgi:sugar/nucleoside kinase (ribokinase family)
MRLGVLGSMVWDRIDHPDGGPVERWGGIAYSLAAAAAALPAGWSVRPIVKVGRDLAADARAFMGALPGLELPGGVRETPERNNRVHLRYRDRHHRDEHLTGGVPPWDWAELEPLLRDVDALYVNLISGFELDLETAARIRSAVTGPIYADLHSLLLGLDPGGRRVPAPLARRDAWLEAFDVVQVNETELELLAGGDDPWGAAERAVRGGLAALLVTRGPAGATALAAGLGPRPWAEPAGGVSRVEVAPSRVVEAGDPTGCGDVWGATCFVALVRGDPLAEAVGAANDAAGRNAGYRGADGLYTFLTEVT